ncbi:unnamed protein product [Durusdinium trenchii]|uniref:Uncharacterized protein n=1 Tax=Durusdinium trenchii TaxID=1381693 RepID=A0ABP0L6E4_9DINO
MTPEKAQQEVNLLVGFLASYAFRALTSSAEAWLRRTCHLCICGRLAREGAVLASERGLTWREAKVRLDSSDDLQILALATLRLLAWHWMQPITYALLLYSWSDDAYFGKTWNLQAVLAAAVLLREVLYFICTLFALVQCPAFLLIDLAATWRSGARGEAVPGLCLCHDAGEIFRLEGHKDSFLTTRRHPGTQTYTSLGLLTV